MGTRYSSKRVLVVDDELEMRIFISNLLKANGFEALDSADPRLALRLARQRQPALIILNAMMADGAGMQLYYRLKQDSRLKETPVLMLSTIESRTLFFCRKLPHQPSDFRPLAPDAYVIKPPEGEELLGLVHRLIYRSRTTGRDGRRSGIGSPGVLENGL